MKENEIEDNLEFIQRKLYKFVNDVSVVVAYFHVMPLLFERKAIRAYLVTNNTNGLAEELPYVEDAVDAAALMTKTYQLNPLEEETLKTLLEVNPDILITGLR